MTKPDKENDVKQDDGSGIDGKPTAYEDITMINREYSPTIQKKVLDSGIGVLNRIMFCELLKQDEKVVGAIGFNTTSGDLYIFKAKAIVLATGSSGIKGGTSPIQFATGDGEVMAYMVGAEIVSKEFVTGSPSVLLTDKHREKQADEGKGISGEICTLYEFTSTKPGSVLRICHNVLLSARRARLSAISGQSVPAKIGRGDGCSRYKQR